MARDATALGGVLVALLTTLGGTALLCFHGKLRQASYLVASIGLGLGLSTLFKSFVDRARPDLVPHGSHVTSASFPSGHSMMSAIIYFTIAALLIRAEERTRIKAFLFISAVLICGLIGLSRIYLGVHWPTDVLGGWTAGAAWALLSHQVATWLKIHDHQPAGAVDTAIPVR